MSLHVPSGQEVISRATPEAHVSPHGQRVFKSAAAAAVCGLTSNLDGVSLSGSVFATVGDLWLSHILPAMHV